MRSLGQPIDNEDIDEMIKEADSNSDGMVDFNGKIKMKKKLRKLIN
jgi:Ca2+-binding EF-hand superfamily protein